MFDFSRANPHKISWLALALFVVLLTALFARHLVGLYGQSVEEEINATQQAYRHVNKPAKGQETDISGWKTYRNEKYGFEVKYPANFEIQISEGYKSAEFSACRGNRCIKFLALDWGPLEVGEGTPYKSYRRLQGSGYEDNGFYFYAIDTGDQAVNDIVLTFKFIELVDTSSWKKYESKNLGFRIKYPLGWFVTFEEEKLVEIASFPKEAYAHGGVRPARGMVVTIAKGICNDPTGDFVEEVFIEGKFVDLERRFCQGGFQISLVLDKFDPEKEAHMKLLETAAATFEVVPRQDIIYFNNPTYKGWSEIQIQNHCSSLGGTFNLCGSACLDTAEVCIQVCAPRCELKAR